jgi:hypothetical protein
MLDSPMLDPLGSLIVELKNDPDVASLVSSRVRGGEPAQGDAKGPNEYQAFIVLTTLDRPPHPSLPIQRAIFDAACYGTTFQNAGAVWGALVKAVHKVGARMKSSGLGIYISVIDSGGEQDKDPDTNQPLVRGTIRLVATAQSVTPAGS